MNKSFTGLVIILGFFPSILQYIAKSVSLTRDGLNALASEPTTLTISNKWYFSVCNDSNDQKCLSFNTPFADSIAYLC